MKKTGIFRDEYPGERKSLINLLMTGYIVTISCLGYAAFYIYIQMGQIERIVNAINVQTQTPEQVEVLKKRLSRSADQLRNEMIGLAVLGTLISIIGGAYTFSMVIRPMRKLVEFAEKKGKADLPEMKTNTELKQLATALTALTSNHNGGSSSSSTLEEAQQKSPGREE